MLGDINDYNTSIEVFFLYKIKLKVDNSNNRKQKKKDDIHPSISVQWIDIDK